MKKTTETILNIAAGKFKPLNMKADHHFLVNLDTMYYNFKEPASIEREYYSWDENHSVEYYCKVDAFEFMERTSLFFDQVTVYRFLEHISFTNVLYFIYLLSTVTKKGSRVDIIVPNYEILANMILKEEVLSPNFEQNNIQLTTELLNEPSCPHASIWTVDRAYYFFEFERRFEIKDCITNFDFDGRNIYLRFLAERI